MINFKDTIFLGRMKNEFGISMSKKEYQEVKSRLEELRDKAPYFSHTSLTFKPISGSYKGILSINGVAVSFYSAKFAKSPLRAFAALEQDISKQIDAWKAKRFSNITYYPSNKKMA